MLAIGPRKQRRLRRLATAWLADRRLAGGPRYSGIRFDAVGVTLDGEGRVVDLEHIEGAF